jgi:hypothetical protein
MDGEKGMQQMPPALQESSPVPVKTVLIVEDDKAIAEFLTIFLRETTPYSANFFSGLFSSQKQMRDFLHFLLPSLRKKIYQETIALTSSIWTIIRLDNKDVRMLREDSDSSLRPHILTILIH